MIRNLTKISLNAFLPARATPIQSAVIQSLKYDTLLQNSTLNSTVSFGFTTKEEKGKKEQKDKPK
jgi:hypothetical protein